MMASVPGSDISVQEQYPPLDAVRPATPAPPLNTRPTLSKDKSDDKSTAPVKKRR